MEINRIYKSKNLSPMKNNIKLAVLVLIMGSLFTFSCKKEEDPADTTPDKWEIFVYGITDCGLCTSFEDDLDKENIPYSFYDINTNNEKRAEMMLKLDAAGIPSDSIHWPVVDVMTDGVSHMFIQPDIDKDIKPLIGM